MLNSAKIVQLPRPALVRLLLAAALLMGLAVAFTVFAGNASAGGDEKITVNSTANIDDGECEGAPNDDEIGNCTLHEAIDMVNNGDADIINFHKPVFSKEQPGVIFLCEDDGEGTLPFIERDLMIDSKNTGVVLDGGDKDDDCGESASYGLFAAAQQNGLDFKLNGGKNFEIRDICGKGGVGIVVSGFWDGDYSLGDVEITGVIVENICDQGVVIEGTNLEDGSVTNSEISSNEDHGVEVFIDACEGERSKGEKPCPLDSSTLDISGNRVEGGADECCSSDGVAVLYVGELNPGEKITASVSDNEIITGSSEGVDLEFFGCGQESGVNFHVDNNDQIRGEALDAVSVSIWAAFCNPFGGGGTSGHEPFVNSNETSTEFDGVISVDDNGDLESEGGGAGVAGFPLGEGVSVNIAICCEESDSSATVSVSGNGRVTGEDDGIGVFTFVCCGDDNSSDVVTSNNDEVTGEGDDGISVFSFAGGGFFAGLVDTGGAGGVGFDADDNVCNITADGNNEVDGVGTNPFFGHGMQLICLAGTIGDPLDIVGQFEEMGDLDLLEDFDLGPLAGLLGGATAGLAPPLSSGDQNTATITVTNNDDIDGDLDGVLALAFSGSLWGEGDENVSSINVSDNGEVTGDDANGVDAWVAAGSLIEEGDDNATEIVISGNQEIGGNGGDGLQLVSLSGGITTGSNDNSTSVSVTGNGDIEGSGPGGELFLDGGGDGISVDSIVCCDPENSNTVDISNNTGEITGHDDDGIDITTCCSQNVITVMDNAGNIRGGDDNGLEIEICSAINGAFGGPPDIDCVKDTQTDLQVMNNSFSDSERDGINICCGAFEDEDKEIKSVISNNVIEGNGDDGIDVESSSGLNIGPNNQIFENGTSAGDNGIEIDWCFGKQVWEDNKFPANHNTITQNSIWGNFGLGIDLRGFDSDGNGGCGGSVEGGSTVGCTIFPFTPIAPNDCIPFPELQTQSGDKLIGISCTECTVEVFWANNEPDNNDDHGEGAEYIVSGEADDDGNFSIDLPCDLGEGLLTATATDKLKNTSEFAENLLTLGTSSCATDTPLPTDTVVPTSTPAETDTPVPTNTLVPTNTPEPEKVCGDVNMDGVANSVDASLVLQLKAGLISSLPNESSGDVNSDGALTSVDAALLLQFTAGLIGEDALTC